MLRRFVPAAAVVLAVALGGAGCADDVAPAAKVGDERITHDQLMDEVAQWAASPTLVDIVTQGATAGGPSAWNTQLVTVVLQNRISFDGFRRELEARSLEVDPTIVESLRTTLFPDPAATAQVLDELDPAFAEQLLDDVAAQLTLSTAIAEEMDDFVTQAFADVEVNPRYGTWVPETGVIVSPEGPRPAPGGSFLEL